MNLFFSACAMCFHWMGWEALVLFLVFLNNLKSQLFFPFFSFFENCLHLSFVIRKCHGPYLEELVCFFFFPPSLGLQE